mmetsp:Transcript_8111/g.14953  ORF Transcript_8111/g.14953 Transcript_8111/m.14953 type:complete len:362 (+) Transcript_8111:185-1270(+)
MCDVIRKLDGNVHKILRAGFLVVTAEDTGGNIVSSGAGGQTNGSNSLRSSRAFLVAQAHMLDFALGAVAHVSKSAERDMLPARHLPSVNGRSSQMGRHLIRQALSAKHASVLCTCDAHERRSYHCNNLHLFSPSSLANLLLSFYSDPGLFLTAAQSNSFDPPPQRTFLRNFCIHFRGVLSLPIPFREATHQIIESFPHNTQKRTPRLVCPHIGLASPSQHALCSLPFSSILFRSLLFSSVLFLRSLLFFLFPSLILSRSLPFSFHVDVRRFEGGEPSTGEVSRCGGCGGCGECRRVHGGLETSWEWGRCSRGDGRVWAVWGKVFEIDGCVCSNDNRQDERGQSKAEVEATARRKGQALGIA